MLTSGGPANPVTRLPRGTQWGVRAIQFVQLAEAGGDTSPKRNSIMQVLTGESRAAYLVELFRSPGVHAWETGRWKTVAPSGARPAGAPEGAIPSNAAPSTQA